jgi:Family of unknown function (DUF5313)
MTRHGRLRYIANGVDRSVPESGRDRVRNDLTDSAARPGHLIRSMLALLPAYAGVALLLPGSPAFRAAALVLAVLLALVDSFAFLAMNTRRRQAQRFLAEDRPIALPGDETPVELWLWIQRRQDRRVLPIGGWRAYKQSPRR